MQSMFFRPLTEVGRWQHSRRQDCSCRHMRGQ